MNYQTSFAVELKLPEKALDFAETMAGRMDEIYQDKPVPEDELTTLIRRKFSDAGDMNINLLGAVLTRTNKKRLLISDDAGEGSVNTVCDFIQTVLEEFELNDMIGISWASICNKPDPGGFGGGAAVITRKDIAWINTGSWLHENMQKIGA